MTTTTAPGSLPGETLADLLEQLGGIEPARVRLHPPPGQATEADLLRLLESPDRRLCELVDGVLVEKHLRFRESLLAAFLIEVLNHWVRSRNLGLVTVPDGPLRLFRGRVRLPDVAFLGWGRFPGGTIPTAPVPDLVPDLAVEILSAGNTPGEMARKREDYFQAGTRLVWEIDPAARQARAYTSAAAFTLLAEHEALDGGDVLPGFTLPLHDLFAQLDRHG